VAAIYSPPLAHAWRHYQALAHDPAPLIAAAEPLVPTSPAAVLVSVPGLSAYPAARYLAAVGAAQPLPSADPIGAFAGFDPLSSSPALAAGLVACRNAAIPRSGLPAP
jgi:hypothetical protein